LKSTISLTIFSLQEAFIALFPYLLVRASCTLLVVFNDYLELVNHAALLSKVNIIYDAFPLLLCISIAVQLARTFTLNKSNFVLICLFGFLTLSGFIQFNGDYLIIVAKSSIVYSILIPLVLCLIIESLSSFKISFTALNSGRVSLINSAFSYLPSYFLVLFLAFFTGDRHQYIFSSFSLLFSDLALEFQAVFHLLISHLIWLLGIHGTTTYRYIFDMTFYTQPIFQNLSYDHFFSVFVIFGGAGSTISLIIAILLSSKDKHSRLVAKSSIPFSIFNINEVIIYGIPIALSRNYIVPFLFVPLFNFALSYALIATGCFSFSGEVVPWTTPPILSGYLLTDSLLGSAWQIALITLGVCIYLPFTKAHSSWINSADILRENLSHGGSPNLEHKEFFIFKQHQQISDDTKAIDRDIKNIINGELKVFYQPQINMSDNTVYGYEALIRLIKNDQVCPPDFLPSVEKAGLEVTLDRWIFQQVRKDIDAWRIENGENPLISINVNPQVLRDKKNVDFIIATFTGYRIKIEIIEKSFAGDFEKINAALGLLRSAGFEVSIDDFGSGYANLSLLGVVNASSIKLDQLLLQHCSTTKGLKLFTSSCATLKEMGFHTICEGVETLEQLQLIKKCQVDVAQGFFYSKAIPLKTAISYSATRNKDIPHIKT